MPRTVTSLGGEERNSSQFPFTLVYFAIPSLPVALCDVDETIYLNRATGAGALTPVTGYTAFVPEPSLSVPDITLANDPLVTDMTLTLSNVNGFWTSVLIANDYRESAIEVWQGNIQMNTGDSPEEASVSGAILVYAGLLDGLAVDIATASLKVAPSYIAPQAMQIPYKFFTPEGFKFLPPPERKLYWGYREVPID